MTLPHLTPQYEKWAPFVARLIFGAAFLLSAFYKIPGSDSFNMQVGMTAEAGLPFAYLAVVLAFLLEIVAAVALIIGWHTRTAAASLAVFILIIAVVFFRDITDPNQFPMFMTCLELTAGLIYVSVYGAQTIAIKKCQLPKHLA